MEFIAAGTAWALKRVPSPQKIINGLGLASLVKPQAWPDLSSKLSQNASIVFPHDPDFSGLVSRWRDWHAPQVGAVVTAFTESDVQEAARYANQNRIPFLARSGGHGATEALQLAKDVLVIDIRGMNDIEIAQEGNYATISGGASVKKVVNELWAADKQTVTGICECVGISAPILGGGHGLLQGQYGLASDQVISARVILPNGEAVTASEESNPDLFWALRGAGHNFGIVTEWKYRIYDVKNPNWCYEIFIFFGDKLEEILELTNRMMQTQPPEVTHWMYIVNIPEIDPDKV
jgi:FAD/FMN-containing dehydrogenase